MQQGSSASATLTDEQILGLEPMPETGAAEVPAAGAARGTPGDPLRDTKLDAEMPQGPDQNAIGRTELQKQNGVVEPAWLSVLEAQAEGGREAAAEAREWRAAATNIAALDAGYFSADAAARSGLAARLYDTDPAAFRAMLAESARLVAQRDPQGLAELAQTLSSADRSHTQRDSSSNRSFGTPQNDNVKATAPGAFPAEAYRSFEATTNDAVARRVQQQIDHTLGQTLPEGTPEGARRRIAEDIFEEVHASLAADRDLARRVGDTLRDWRFDAGARAQVTDLLSGRARAVLPEVARRVVAEWTSSVLASDRAKSARVAAASARRDVTGGRLPEPVPASSLRPRNIDYRRLSDEQILDL